MIKHKDKYGPKLFKHQAQADRERRAEVIDSLMNQAGATWWINEVETQLPSKRPTRLVENLLEISKVCREAESMQHHATVQRDELIKAYGGKAW